MKGIFESMKNTIKHLEVVHDIFCDERNFRDEEKSDYNIYKQNEEKLREDLNRLALDAQLYSQKGRQMSIYEIF